MLKANVKTGPAKTEPAGPLATAMYCVQADLSGGEHGQWEVYQREQRPRHPNNGQKLLPPHRYCTCTHTHMHAHAHLQS